MIPRGSEGASPTGAGSVWGNKVIINPWIPAGEVVIMGEMVKPEGWATMSREDRACEAIRQGCAVLVKNIDVLRG